MAHYLFIFTGFIFFIYEIFVLIYPAQEKELKKSFETFQLFSSTSTKTLNKLQTLYVVIVLFYFPWVCYGLFAFDEYLIPLLTWTVLTWVVHKVREQSTEQILLTRLDALISICFHLYLYISFFTN